MTRPRPQLGLLVAAAVITSALGACGIPTDEEPRAIPSSSSSTTSTNVSTPCVTDSGSVNTVQQTVYLIEGGVTAGTDEERLVPVTVCVPNTSDDAELIQSTLEELIALPSEGGHTNNIPSGTSIRSVGLDDDGTELTVDLSEDFNDVQQTLQRRAFAQLVFSATGVTPTGVERVSFSIDGTPTVAATGDDVTPAAGEPVTRADYPAFESTIASVTTELGES